MSSTPPRRPAATKQYLAISTCPSTESSLERSHGVYLTSLSVSNAPGRVMPSGSTWRGRPIREPSRICPHFECESPNPLFARYCRRCGWPLVRPAPPPAPPPPPRYEPAAPDVVRRGIEVVDWIAIAGIVVGVLMILWAVFFST